MNKMNNLWLVCISCFTLIFAACEKDEPTPPVGSNGVLLINQGNFGQGNGSIDVYYPASKEATPDAYRAANGEAIGGIIQSASIADDLLVVMVNQMGDAGKVVFADAATLEKEHELRDPATLYSPRYAAVTNNHIFVSVWGPYETNYSLKNSSIAVINRESHQLEKSIKVPAGPEGVLVEGNNLWVANSFTDSITVINVSTQQVVQKFKTVNKPKQVEKGPNGKIWVLAGDTISRYNPSNFALEKKIKLPGSATKWQFVGNELYFLTQAYSPDWKNTYNKLFKLDISQEAAQPQLVIDKDDTPLFWVNPESKEIYLGVAAGADPGTLLRLSPDGTELDRQPAGVFPQQLIAR